MVILFKYVIVVVVIIIIIIIIIYLWVSSFLISFWKSLTQTPVGRFLFSVHRISEAMLKADDKLRLKGKNG